MVQAALTAHERREKILLDVREERRRQVLEHNDASMIPESWVARIVKHVGRGVSNDPVVFRRAMVVVAALAVAAIEWVDERFER
jgi:hypothetical protein